MFGIVLTFLPLLCISDELDHVRTSAYQAFSLLFLRMKALFAAFLHASLVSSRRVVELLGQTSAEMGCTCRSLTARLISKEDVV